MAYKVGGKFIIEIGGKYIREDGYGGFITENPLYHVKGFDSLVFDENGLNKLKNYNEECDGVRRINDADREYCYQKGLNDAWEAAMKIVLGKENGGLLSKELRMIFGTDSWCSIFAKNTASEAIQKIKAYEEQKRAEEEIKVGDEVENVSGDRYVILYVYHNSKNELRAQGFGHNGTISQMELNRYAKTGRHFDIEGILKAMREE